MSSKDAFEPSKEEVDALLEHVQAGGCFGDALVGNYMEKREHEKIEEGVENLAVADVDDDAERKKKKKTPLEASEDGDVDALLEAIERGEALEDADRPRDREGKPSLCPNIDRVRQLGREQKV